MIDLNNFNPEHIKTTVFYSSYDIIILRTPTGITFQNKTKTINITLKNTYTVYAIPHKEDIIIISGTVGIIIDKDGKYETFELKNIIPIHKPEIIDDKLIYVSSIGNLCHFVIFDIEKRKRIYQTQSNEFSSFSSTISKNNLCLMINSSQLYCFNAQGELLWKKFDQHGIVPGINQYKDRILYCSGNHIKLTNGTQSQQIPITDIKIDELLHVSNDKLYVLCNGRKNIGCIDLKTGYIKYEIKTLKQIKGTIFNQAKIDNNLGKIFCFYNDTNLGIVDLKTVTNKIYNPINKIRDISFNSDMIINTYDGESHIVREEKKENIIEI